MKSFVITTESDPVCLQILPCESTSQNDLKDKAASIYS